MSSALAFLFGLGGLLAGAELLVRGASRLASLLGLSPLVIGLTVVAFGTSAPELAVSVAGALEGKSALAFGNAVGSNVFNLLVILGLAALATPLAVAQRLVRIDLPLLIAVSGLTWLLAANGRLGRLEGLALVAGIVAYTAFAVRQGRREDPAVAAEYAGAFAKPSRRHVGTALATAGVVGGLILLVLGSRFLLEGAVGIARALGLGEKIIGLTLVAAGTSLPELATSVVAGLRGQRDIAVGNVVGSNLFNLTAVLGGSAAVAASGLTVPAGATVDFAVMMGATVLALPLAVTGGRISRREGGLFLILYVIYTVYLMRG